MKGHHYSRHPDTDGVYRVVWLGWRTVKPLFMTFQDGEWVNLQTMRWHYARGEYPGEFYWHDSGP